MSNDIQTDTPRNRRAADRQTDDEPLLLDPAHYRRRMVIEQLNGVAGQL